MNEKNFKRKNCLFYTMTGDNLDIIKMVLEFAGVNVNAADGLRYLIALLSEENELLQLLSDYNHKDINNTTYTNCRALHVAFGYFEGEIIIAMLLDAGFDGNICAGDGFLVLQYIRPITNVTSARLLTIERVANVFSVHHTTGAIPLYAAVLITDVKLLNSKLS